MDHGEWKGCVGPTGGTWVPRCPHARGGGDVVRESGGGWRGLLLALVVGSCCLIYEAAKVVIPLLLRIGWEAVKLLGHLLAAILSSGRR